MKKSLIAAIIAATASMGAFAAGTGDFMGTANEVSMVLIASDATTGPNYSDLVVVNFNNADKCIEVGADGKAGEKVTLGSHKVFTGKVASLISEKGDHTVGVRVSDCNPKAKKNALNMSLGIEKKVVVR